MKVWSRELGKINDAQSMVEILDENDVPVEWVVCSFYDSRKPFGSQWSWGHYFSNFVDACLYVHEKEMEELINRSLNDNECRWLLKDFKKKDGNGIMLWIPSKNEAFQVMIGTGDNLSKEDIEQGFDSYLYIKTYTYDDPDFEEWDGGELMYRSEEQSYDNDITTAVYDALEFHYDSVPYFIPLQIFWH